MSQNNPSQNPKAIEQQLLARLKVMGYILCFFAAGAFAYVCASTSIPSTANDQIDTYEELETVSAFSAPAHSPPFTLTPEERSHFLIISGIFGALGATCILTAWRRSKKAC
jgi:hypothetical protein